MTVFKTACSKSTDFQEEKQKLKTSKKPIFKTCKNRKTGCQRSTKL